MTPTDTAKVLAKIASYDRRTVGDTDILAWHEALNDLDARDALDAVTAHYRAETRWLMPADIRHHAETAANRRLQANRRIPHDYKQGRSPGYCRRCGLYENNSIHRHRLTTA